MILKPRQAAVLPVVKSSTSPVHTPSAASTSSAQVTATPTDYRGPKAWSITTLDMGGTLAVNSAGSAWLAPPATKTKGGSQPGVQTMVIVANAIYGGPVLKITPVVYPKGGKPGPSGPGWIAHGPQARSPLSSLVFYTSMDD